MFRYFNVSSNNYALFWLLSVHYVQLLSKVVMFLAITCHICRQLFLFYFIIIAFLLISIISLIYIYILFVSEYALEIKSRNIKNLVPIIKLEAYRQDLIINHLVLNLTSVLYCKSRNIMLKFKFRLIPAKDLHCICHLKKFLFVVMAAILDWGQGCHI